MTDGAIRTASLDTSSSWPLSTTGSSCKGLSEHVCASVGSSLRKSVGGPISVLFGDHSRLVELFLLLWRVILPIKDVSPRSRGLREGGRCEMGRTRSASETVELPFHDLVEFNDMGCSCVGCSSYTSTGREMVAIAVRYDQTVVQRCRRQQYLTFRARHFLLLPVGLIVSHSRAAAEQGGQPALHVTILVDEEAH